MRTRKGKYSLWVGGGQPGTGAPGVAATINVVSGTALPD
jgi:beta-glucosidase